MTNRDLAQVVIELTTDLELCSAVREAVCGGVSAFVSPKGPITRPKPKVLDDWTNETLMLRLAILDTKMLYDAPND